MERTPGFAGTAPAAGGERNHVDRTSPGARAAVVRRKRRHPARRSRVVAAVLSALTFLGLTGSMAARAAISSTARSGGSSTGTTSSSGSTSSSGPSSSGSSSSDSGSTSSSNDGSTSGSGWSAQPGSSSGFDQPNSISHAS